MVALAEDTAVAAATGSLRATTTTTATAAVPETISADPLGLLPDGKFPFVRPVCPGSFRGRLLDPSCEIRRWHFSYRFVPRRKGYRDKSLLPDENKLKCCPLDVFSHVILCAFHSCLSQSHLSSRTVSGPGRLFPIHELSASTLPAPAMGSRIPLPFTVKCQASVALSRLSTVDHDV